MPPKGVLGLAGGSLIFVILALAYIFTDRGRQVGDQLGRSASERLERLFPDEAGSGEGGGTEPETPFEAAPNPEVEGPPANYQPEPNGLPPQGGGGTLYPIPPDVPIQTRLAAVEAALQAQQQGGFPPALGAPAVGGARGVPTVRLFAPPAPAEAAQGYAVATVSSTRTTEDGRTAQSGTAYFAPPSQSRTFSASQRAEYIARRTGQAPAADVPQGTITSSATSRAPANINRARSRGQQLATQRQTTSPSQTRPRSQSSSEILASYNTFRSNTNFNQRGAQYGT